MFTNRYYVVRFSLIDGVATPDGLHEYTAINAAVDDAKACAFGGGYVGTVIFHSALDSVTGSYRTPKPFVAMGAILEDSDIAKAAGALPPAASSRHRV